MTKQIDLYNDYLNNKIIDGFYNGFGPMTISHKLRLPTTTIYKRINILRNEGLLIGTRKHIKPNDQLIGQIIYFNLQFKNIQNE